jgi:TRAP-type transport system small permease protein
MSPGRKRVSAFCGWLAAICLTGMMLVTVADVVLRHFLDKPIRGVIEIVELLLTGAFFLALPAVFFREEHIVVDILDHSVPRAVPWLKRISAFLAVILLAVMAWQGLLVARDMAMFGDVTSDLSWPKLWYWIPVLAGIVGGALAAAVMMFDKEAQR